MSWKGRLAGLALLLLTNVAAADEKPLFIVHFEAGPQWDKTLSPGEQPSFREHSANLNRLRSEGVIVFGARYDEYGLIFLRADSLDAAKAAVDGDPGVRSGLFVCRVAPLGVFYPWKEMDRVTAMPESTSAP
jgi:hypothetical protein